MIDLKNDKLPKKAGKEVHTRKFNFFGFFQKVRGNGRNGVSVRGNNVWQKDVNVFNCKSILRKE